MGIVVLWVYHTVESSTTFCGGQDSNRSLPNVLSNQNSPSVIYVFRRRTQFQKCKRNWRNVWWRNVWGRKMKLHLITEQHTGAPGRAYFAGTDRKQIGGVWTTVVLWDDDPVRSIPMEPDIAQAARDRCPSGLVTYLAYATDGPY